MTTKDRVYTEAEIAEKLNKELLIEPQFFDATPGAQRYVSYYVTAVDRAGNESSPSREIVVVLKE